MLQPPAASIFLGFSGSPHAYQIGDKLAQMNTYKPLPPRFAIQSTAESK